MIAADVRVKLNIEFALKLLTEIISLNLKDPNLGTSLNLGEMILLKSGYSMFVV